MGSGAVVIGFPLAMSLVTLAGLAAAVSALARLGVTRAVVTASVRAVAQLVAVSLVIAAVLRSGWGTAAFVGVMLLVAAATSARRITTGHAGRWAAVALSGGAVPVGALVLAAGTVPMTTVAVLPVAGILIGGAMTATSLAGRRALDELHNRYGEYEAALALGFTTRDAVLEVCRPSAAQALVPALDQTRTVG